MDNEEIKKINKFVEDWRDHFYHGVDGCEADADDMLSDWERLKEELKKDVNGGIGE